VAADRSPAARHPLVGNREPDRPESRDPEERLLSQAVLRLNVVVLGFLTGGLAALVLFVATNWLVLKGGPRVGPHLTLLAQFFPGYTVTFTGSLIGAAYAFVVGYLAGVILAYAYNRVVDLRSS
jgi:hypothetical protein